MSHKAWFHWDYISGLDPLTSFSDDHAPFIPASPSSERVTVLRTRLSIWAWWASNGFPQPGPAQTCNNLKAKIQFNKAETGDFPAPAGWPADPGYNDEAWKQPTVYDTLQLAAQTYRPPDPVAMTPQVFYGWAQLPNAAGDSAAQRRLEGTYIITPWLAISQGTTDWGDSYPGGTDPIEFYFNARLSVLYEYDG